MIFGRSTVWMICCLLCSCNLCTHAIFSSFLAHVCTVRVRTKTQSEPPVNGSPMRFSYHFSQWTWIIAGLADLCHVRTPAAFDRSPHAVTLDLCAHAKSNNQRSNVEQTETGEREGDKISWFDGSRCFFADRLSAFFFFFPFYCVIGETYVYGSLPQWDRPMSLLLLPHSGT